MLRRIRLKDYNFRLILYVVALSLMGVLLVGSARPSLQTRQLAGVILGITAMIVVSLFDYSWILQFQWPMYLVAIALLTICVVLGKTTKGATRWIKIGSFTFQPVEVVKIILILFFAKLFMDHIGELNKFHFIVRAVLLIGFPLALIFLQPDLKNTITVFVLFVLLYYAAGLSYKIIFGVAAVIIPLVAVFLFVVIQYPEIKLINDYQRDRIMTFFYPEDEEYTDDAVQQRNSVTAIGSGQLTGKGLKNDDVSSANNGNFISDNHNDFIFSVIGEELGFLGSVAIILLLLLIVLECLMTSRKAKDLAGKVICAGMASIIGIQGFLNIGVATGILPNTGTPLPFISYGLTSLVSMYIGMGFVLNVGMQEKIRVGGRKA